MEKLKILILNYEYPPLGGGAGIMTKRLAEGFIEEGHNVTVITSDYPGLEDENKKGLQLIRLKVLRKRKDRSNPKEMYSWMRKAKKYCTTHIKRGDFDICLANFTIPGGPVAFALKKKIGLPYVILSHGHDIPWFYPKQMFVWHLMLFPLIKKICLEASNNVLLTPEMKSMADKFIGEKLKHKNVIIGNGMDLINLNGVFKNDKLKVLFVGRMVEQKDPLQFVKAVSLLNQQGVEAQYEMLGDGPLMGKVKQLMADERIGNIKLLGKVDHERVLEEMRKAHIMIQPSLHEAMSISVLEAISCGVYVITTPVSGNKQIIINRLNGLLVPHDDLDAIVREVKRFEQQELVKRNKKFPTEYFSALAKEFSWHSSIEKYLKLFYDILSQQKLKA
ncbi:MAG: glycosyltransferase family 4 protein [Chitinophagales bacterium]